jgi:hypothetical protein
MESGKENSERRDQDEAGAEFNRRLFLTQGAGVAIVTLLLLLWYTFEVLLLIFAGNRRGGNVVIPSTNARVVNARPSAPPLPIAEARRRAGA